MYSSHIKALLAIMACCLISCGKEQTGNPETDDQHVEQPKPDTYKIGDFYSQGLARGIVVHIESNGEHGLLMSLSEGQAKWSTENVFLFYQVMPQTFSRDDGSRNMALIKGLENWTTKYPAFAWCNKMNIGDSITWYLPSVTEGEYIAGAYRNHKQAIDQALAANSGAPISSDARYWSSEEATAGSAYSFSASYEGEFFLSDDKSATLSVRAVRKF